MLVFVKNNWFWLNTIVLLKLKIGLKLRVLNGSVLCLILYDFESHIFFGKDSVIRFCLLNEIG